MIHDRALDPASRRLLQAGEHCQWLIISWHDAKLGCRQPFDDRIKPVIDPLEEDFVGLDDPKRMDSLRLERLDGGLLGLQTLLGGKDSG